MINHPYDPIGVLDSGVGGISVLRELVKLLPGEDFVFYGDSANAPYGTKTSEQVRELTFRSTRYLMEHHHVKAIVVACNTATSAAITSLREEFPDQIIIGIEPAVKPAAQAYGKDRGRVLVMATPTTLKNEKFLYKMLEFEEKAEIIPIPCEGLMEYVEAGVTTGPALETYLSEKICRYLPAQAIVLGCTHYPFVREAIEKITDHRVQLFDGGEGTARETARRLRNSDLLNDPSRKGNVTFLNSKENDKKILELCYKLLKEGSV